ncbi:MAG: hypothetical protein HYV45_00815 [Candidatus Moranbacteria bacterium]|nr:hypothetical protein [Candidatus Moranbacteria bacterium]
MVYCERFEEKSLSIVLTCFARVMSEKKRQEKPKVLTEIEKEITEILVVGNRSYEPFIKTFHYSGENVVAASLGTLIGIFEITEKSEDAAYIVNFLSSVARKEYFNNPRRGAIESFEAALHKINLALAELVKHGNISWLGKLHGTLGIIEKNNIHFSVTGQGTILLSRNGTLSEISVGLASEESSSHPIKTFVEVSSGRLLPEDKIIFTSPEPLSLLPLDLLEKQVARMNKEQFAQFLRTAITNELDRSGIFIIDCEEKIIQESPKKHSSETRQDASVMNAFSNATFIEKSPTSIATAENAPEEKDPLPKDYIDSKTGHIYVHGNTPDSSASHPSIERLSLFFQNILHAFNDFFAGQKRFFRKVGKQGSLSLYQGTEKLFLVSRNTGRFLKKKWQKNILVAQEKVKTTSFLRHLKKDSSIIEKISEEPSFSPTDSVTMIDPATIPETPDFLKEKIASFYQKNNQKKITPGISNQLLLSLAIARRKLGNVSNKLLFHLRVLFRTLSLRYIALSPLQKKIFFSVVIFLSLLSLTLFFLTTRPATTKETPNTILENEETIESLSSLNNKKFPSLENGSTLATQEAPFIKIVLLDNEVYGIGENTVFSLREQKTYSFPRENGTIRLATAMDDLSLIFLYTTKKELYSFSSITHAFTKNNLDIPEGADIQSIGTYLTYLYALDSAHDQIYRFPRATGGFGTASFWLKEKTSCEDNATFAIHETLFLSCPDNTLSSFFRGRLVTRFSLPDTPFTLTTLFTAPDLTHIYALDASQKMFYIFRQDGTLFRRYSLEKIPDALSFVVNEKNNELFIMTNHTLLSFKIEIQE